MADIRHTMSLDDSRFAQGLKHAEGLADKNVKAMQSGFGRLGSAFDGALRFAVIDQAFKRSFGIAQNAVNAYASEFTFARQELRRFESAFHEFNISLGRDLTGLVSGGGWVESMIRGASRLREWTVNKLTDMMMFEAGTGEGVDNRRKREEDLDKRIQQMEKFRDLKGDLGRDLASSEGRQGDAARIAETDRHRRRLMEIGALGLGRGSGELAEIEKLETDRHDAEMKRIDEADAKQKASEDRRRENAQHEVEVEDRRLGLQQMRLNGKTKEAELGEFQLQMDERRRAIEQDDVLTQDQKQTALDNLWNQQIGLEAAMKNRRDREQGSRGFSGSDVADARVRAQILGPGAGSKPADAVAKNTKDTADEAKRQTDLLRSIDRSIGRQWVGVFG